MNTLLRQTGLILGFLGGASLAQVPTPAGSQSKSPAEHVTAVIESGSSRLNLPLRSALQDELAELDPPCTSAPLEMETTLSRRTIAPEGVRTINAPISSGFWA